MQLKDRNDCNFKCRKIYVKARKRGISYVEMHEQLKWRYGVESSRDLTLEQYREILTQLNYLPLEPELEIEIIKSQKQWYEDHKEES